MDRRQRKTRGAIFTAFTDLLSKKEYPHITVGEIIDRADVGRATFYAHFETKEQLLDELCKELCCHILDAVTDTPPDHHHIFTCDAPDSVFLHLFKHLEHNDHHILRLLSGRNAELFLPYFKKSAEQLVRTQLPLFAHRKSDTIPDDFWVDHIVSVLINTIRWWIEHGTHPSAAIITEYFFAVV